MSPRKKQRKPNPPHPLSKLFLLYGIGLILIGLMLFLLIFWPVIQLEITYRFRSFPTAISIESNTPSTLKPVDTLFGIVIPKIGANAKVIPNVDPYNSAIYQHALTKGVAHAKGTVFPGRVGNMFIFSHSSVNFYEAMRFNSIFYLLDKLTNDDVIYIFYNNMPYIYKIFEIQRVNPKNISYLTEKTNEKRLTLMTCWPPGTTFERLIVRAKLVE